MKRSLLTLLSLLAVYIAWKYEYLKTKPQKFPKITICPSFVPSKIGFVTEQHSKGQLFPVEGLGKDGGLILSSVNKNGLVKYGWVPKEHTSTGRFAGQQVESFMMNWFPAEFSRAVILDPPVIIASDRPESRAENKPNDELDVIKSLELLFPGKEIWRVGENNQLVLAKEDSDKLPQRYTKNEGQSDGKDKVRHLKGLTRIKSINCTQTLLYPHSFPRSVMKQTIVDVHRASRDQYLNTLGVNVHWLNSCIVIDGNQIEVLTTDDHITCDLELSGDHLGLYAYIDNQTSGTWLSAYSWVDIGLSGPYQTILGALGRYSVVAVNTIDLGVQASARLTKSDGKPKTITAAKPSLRQQRIRDLFRPASDEPRLHMTWAEWEDSILHCKVAKPSKDFKKIAAFDLDGTLIHTKSGLTFARNEFDWRFYHDSIPIRLRELHSSGYRLVVFTNQAGLSHERAVNTFKNKIEMIAKQINLPLDVIAARKKDENRKPDIGMFNYFLRAYGKEIIEEHHESFFVGDAAGRPATEHKGADHSDADLGFATKALLKFHTPEDYFQK